MKTPKRKTDRLSERNRELLARGVTGIFDFWELRAEARRTLLGFKRGDWMLEALIAGAPLSADPEVLERAGHITAIYKSLGILAPRNPEYTRQWMTSRNRAFNGMTPLKVVEKQGLVGLKLLRAYLDHACSQ